MNEKLPAEIVHVKLKNESKPSKCSGFRQRKEMTGIANMTLRLAVPFLSDSPKVATLLKERAEFESNVLLMNFQENILQTTC